MYHRCHTSTAFSDIDGRDNHVTMRDSATVRAVEDYTNKYKPRVSIPFEPCVWLLGHI